MRRHLLGLGSLIFSPLPSSSNPVSVDVNVGTSLGEYVPTYRFFGADEPNYAYYPDGEALLTELGQLGNQTYFRAHNLLTTGPGFPSLKFGSTNAYTETPDGQPIYNWTVVDRIFDAYLSRGVKPYVEVGFMPLALSTHPYPYFFNFTPSSPYDAIYTGWSDPPTSYAKWGQLVYEWAAHSVARYGAAEVESWYWEVWNEPNIQYWNGTISGFYELNDYAVDGVRRALPSARVGGPAVAGGPAGSYLGDFLDHVLNGTNYATNETGTPLDFVSFHAKGAPTYVNDSNVTGGGYVQMGIAAQLQNIDQAFDVIASYPTVKDKPIVISEDDPDGCAACITPQYGYRNSLLYPSFDAAAFVRAMDLSLKYGVNLQGTLTWAFEYDDHAYFDGFRVLSTNKVDKPILNLHRMLGKISGTRVQAMSSGQVPLESAIVNSINGSMTDTGALASFNQTTNTLFIFVWHYHDDNLPKPDSEVTVKVRNLPSGDCAANITHYRIDNQHSNSYQKWLQMGSPQDPTSQQYSELKQAGMLQTLSEPDDKRKVRIEKGEAQVDFELPIHATSLLVLQM
ncbi:MAG: hypothetical protein M1821_001968 [Bathelium mastoideum]|nr:MAG: hypothetical protein M1821_001968 [Bathelium mastoideum]